MPEAKLSAEFRERFAPHLDFQERLFKRLDPEGTTLIVSHCRAVAHHLFENGVDEDTVFAALLHNLKAEHLFVHSPDITHVLQSRGAWNEPKGEITPKAFKAACMRALDIVKSYRQIVDDAGTQVNVSFALAVEDESKLKASLLRVADLRERLDISDPRKIDVAEHVYVPWADALGFVKLRDDLGEQIVKTRNPVAYAKIKRQLDAFAQNQKAQRAFTELKTVLGKRLDAAGIAAYLEPRGENGLKSVYSIYRKMADYHLPVGNEDFDPDVKLMHDLFGLRVRVITTRRDTEAGVNRKLNRVMEIIRELDAENKSGVKISKFAEIDDYVSNPKPSGYSAIHVPVRFGGSHDLPGEIHLVTDEMHDRNEFGIPSSHLWYKLRDLEDPLRARLVSLNESLSKGVPINNLFKTEVPTVKIRLVMPLGETNYVEVPSKATAADVWFYLNLPDVVESSLNPKKKLYLSGVSVNKKKADLSKTLNGGENVMFTLSAQPLGADKIKTLLGKVTTAQAENAFNAMLSASPKTKRK